MEYGRIILSWQDGEFVGDPTRFAFEWEGQSAWTKIWDIDLWRVFGTEPDLAQHPVGSAFWFGPYRLVVAEQDFFSGGLTVRRVNGEWTAWLAGWWLRGRYLLRLINNRLKATAYIWGLMHREEGRVSYWADLRPYRWLVKRRK